MVASTLLGLSGSHEGGHRFKNLIQSPHFPADKMAMMHFQKQMISLVFGQQPMAFLLSLTWLGFNSFLE